MFPVLNNLLLVFVFAIASFGASSLMLTGGIQNEDVGRRKLVTENPGFISIDCGANGDYHDEATGIVYRTDREFIDTGENHEVSTENGNYLSSDNLIQRQLKNLRSFPNGTRNCYTLNCNLNRVETTVIWSELSSITEIMIPLSNHPSLTYIWVLIIGTL